MPRTKVIERNNSGESGAVHVNREVLIHEDPAAHRLYYTCSDGLLVGVRNYLASWTLDALDSGRCRMRITADFDVTRAGEPRLRAQHLRSMCTSSSSRASTSYLAQRGGKYVPMD